MTDQQHLSHHNNSKFTNYKRSRSRSHSREKFNKSKLHIGNLPLDITENKLKQEFQQYGDVKEVRIIKFNQKGEQLEKNCYAFLTMATSHQAERAVMQNKGKEWQVAFRKSDHEREKDKEYKFRPKKDYNSQSNNFNSNNNYNNSNQSNNYHDQRLYRRNKWSNNNESDYKGKEGYNKHRYNNQGSSQSSSSPSHSSDSSNNYNNNNNSKNNYRNNQQQKNNNNNYHQKPHHYNNSNNNQQRDAHHDSQQISNAGQQQQQQQQQQHQSIHPMQQNLLVNLQNLGQDKQDINALASLLSLPSDQLKTLLEQQKNGNNGIIQEQILVRELWVGGLPIQCTDKKLEKNMEIYGKIEHLELFNKGFAFVKYYKVIEATKAFLNQKTISLLLDAPNLKIFFSDHLRRFNIVGDNQEYQEPDDQTNIIYIGYQHNSEAANEDTIRKAVKNYGVIKNINLKYMENTTLKRYALVEFETIQQAQKVNEKFNSNKKHKLQDKKCEVAILLKSQKLYQNKEIEQLLQRQRQQQHPQPTQNQIIQPQMPINPQNQLLQNVKPLNANNPNFIPNFPLDIQQQQQIPQMNLLQSQQIVRQQQQLPQQINRQIINQQPPLQQNNQILQQIQMKKMQPNPVFQQQQPPQISLQPPNMVNQIPIQQIMQNQPNIPQQQPPPSQLMIPQPQQQVQVNRFPSQQFPNNQPIPQQNLVQNQNQQINSAIQYISQQQQNNNQQAQQNNQFQQQQQQQQLQQQQQFLPNFQMPKIRNENQMTPEQINLIQQALNNQNILTAINQQNNLNNKVDELANLLQQKNQGNNNNNSIETNRGLLLDLISEQLKKFNEDKKQNKQIEMEKIESDDNTFWSGFITRQKQNRVGIDARIVKQLKDINMNEYHLNVTHRTSFDEAMKKDYSAFVVFTPSNQTEYKQFDEYINYFRNKQKAGVVQTQNYHIYLLPPCPDVRKLYPIKDREILGIFSDSAALDKEYDISDNQNAIISNQLEQQDQQFVNNQKINNNNNQSNNSDDITKLLSNPQLIDSLLQTIGNSK